MSWQIALKPLESRGLKTFRVEICRKADITATLKIFTERFTIDPAAFFGGELAMDGRGRLRRSVSVLKSQTKCNFLMYGNLQDLSNLVIINRK